MSDENGLVYMRARYYSPTLKRFINADVVAGSITNSITLNRYAYANGNPVSNVDPLGLSPDVARGMQGEVISSDYDLLNVLKIFLSQFIAKGNDVYNSLKEYVSSLLDQIQQDKCKQSLKNSINDTITDQYQWTEWFGPAKMVANMRFNKAFEEIDQNKDVINSVSKKYNIPAEIIASIILKEQYTKSLPDCMANLHTRLFGDSPHSVGLGAITPGTAKAAWASLGVYDYESYSNAEMQSKLMSDDFNIETIAVVLLYEMRLDDGTYATLDQLKDSIKEYNGSRKYADYVVQYLYDMRRYLSYD